MAITGILFMSISILMALPLAFPAHTAAPTWQAHCTGGQSATAFIPSDPGELRRLIGESKPSGVSVDLIRTKHGFLVQTTGADYTDLAGDGPRSTVKVLNQVPHDLVLSVEPEGQSFHALTMYHLRYKDGAGILNTVRMSYTHRGGVESSLTALRCSVSGKLP